MNKSWSKEWMRDYREAACETERCLVKIPGCEEKP